MRARCTEKRWDIYLHVGTDLGDNKWFGITSFPVRVRYFINAVRFVIAYEEVNVHLAVTKKACKKVWDKTVVLSSLYRYKCVKVEEVYFVIYWTFEKMIFVYEQKLHIYDIIRYVSIKQIVGEAKSWTAKGAAENTQVYS